MCIHISIATGSGQSAIKWVTFSPDQAGSSEIHSNVAVVNNICSTTKYGYILSEKLVFVFVCPPNHSHDIKSE